MLAHDTPGPAPELPDAEQVFTVSSRTPLQALAGAYADRLALLRERASAGELADSTAIIAGLEQLILIGDDRRIPAED
jgi:hypothetical protein